MNSDHLRVLALLLIFLPGIPLYFAYFLAMTVFAAYRLAPPPLTANECSLVRHILYALLFLTCVYSLLWCVAHSSLFDPRPDLAALDLTGIDTVLLLAVAWFPWLPLALGIAGIRSNPLWIARFLQRPKILLFRPFSDKSASAVIFYHLARVLSEMGRVYALVPSGHLSARRELRNQVFRLTLPHLNVLRLLTVADKCWQDHIRDLLSDADAVIIDVTHPTESVEWELELALQIVGQSRIILLVQEGCTLSGQFLYTIAYQRPAWLLLPERTSTAVASLKGALAAILTSRETSRNL